MHKTFAPPPETLTRDELLAYIKSLDDMADVEDRHIWVDQALLAHINDSEIWDAYNDLEMWYA